MLAAVSGREAHFRLLCAQFLFIVFIINLRVLSVGCNVNGCYIGCLMYADDLILLSATMNGLQAMRNAELLLLKQHRVTLVI